MALSLLFCDNVSSVVRDVRALCWCVGGKKGKMRHLIANLILQKIAIITQAVLNEHFFLIAAVISFN